MNSLPQVKGLDWQLHAKTKQVNLKIAFEYLGMSRLTAFSGICGLSGFHCTGKNKWFQQGRF